MIKLGGLSGYLYKGRKRKARLHLEYPLVFVLGDSLGYFNINQYSEEWTGLRDRLFMFFFPHVNFPNELSVTPSKRFSPQVVASRFFFYAVSQPWPGSSATTRIISKESFMAPLSHWWKKLSRYPSRKLGCETRVYLDFAPHTCGFWWSHTTWNNK